MPAQAASNFDLSAGTGSCTATVPAECTWAASVLTVLNGADIEITGTVTNGTRIEVAANATATITLNDVNISGLAGLQSPLRLNNGADLTLLVEGTNTLTAGATAAGIRAPAGTSLTIDSTVTGTSAGTLTANSGSPSPSSSGAGIGDGVLENAGTITIKGGTITAVSVHTGAGIGGGDSGSGGVITISGGTVIAKSTYRGAGIGGGVNGAGGTITIIGTADVTATGGESLLGGSSGSGAGIGSGGTSTGTPYPAGTITIDTSAGAKVNATGGPSAATGGVGAAIGEGGYGNGGDGAGLAAMPPAPYGGGSGPTVPPGGNATLTCPAQGAGYTYQWQQWQATPAPGSWNNMAGATAATLTLPAVTAAMSGNQYRCVSTIPIGGGNTFNFPGDPATLTVKNSTAAAVPTLNEWALMLLALAMLGMAGAGFKRRV